MLRQIYFSIAISVALLTWDFVRHNIDSLPYAEASVLQIFRHRPASVRAVYAAGIPEGVLLKPFVPR